VDYSHVLDEEQYSDGQEIVREGGHGKWIWVILKGLVSVNRETPNVPITIGRLGQGCFLGTFTALSSVQYTRSATIAALGDVQLGLLDTELLSREFTSLSPDFRRILLSMDGRLRKITDSSVELFVKEDKNERFSKDKNVIIKKGSSTKEVLNIM